MKRNDYSALEKIYNNSRLDVFAMAVSHLMDIGFRTAMDITDEDIEALDGNGLMTKSFVQALVSLSRDIALACSSPTELIVLCNKYEIFDSGTISRKRLKDILCNYVCNDFETASPGYVRDVLYDYCGCDDDELEEIGLEWLILEDDEEE